jgi:hypothetical protein
MDQSPSSPDAAGHGPGPAAHPGMPRWVKVFGIATGCALLTALVLMHALGGGMGGH